VRSLAYRRQSSIHTESLQGILCTVVISHARFQVDDDLFAPYEVIGELGARPVHVYVARQSALAVGGAQLVIAEHFPGACKTGGSVTRTDLRREARRISTLANPHLARVREVVVRGDDLVVFGDFLDGEKLTEFWRPGQWLPLEIALRILLDVLTGVGALHGLRDSNQQPMKLTHGEISPATVLFGSDGVARVLHAVARRATDVVAEAGSLPYLAPEVHTGDAHDGRADVFSVGVLLWEVLMGALLTNDGEEAAGLRVRSGALPAPSAPEKTPWAKALVPVVTRALAANPEDRWPTAAAMAAEIRKAAGLKLAAASAAAALAKGKFGDRVKQRRARWESRPSRPPVMAPPPLAGIPDPPASVAAPESAAGTSGLQQAQSIAVPLVRSEEFSSSMLESFKPPPPPAAREPLDGAQVDAFLDTHGDVPGPLGLELPGVARRDSSFSIPPFEAAPPVSIPEPPLSAEAVPLEAPVVFDEVDVHPIAAPLGDRSPLPPALSSSGAPAGTRSRRRNLLLGGVAVLGIAAVSVVAVHAAHRTTPPAVAAAQPTAPAAVAPPMLPSAVSATPAALKPTPTLAPTPASPPIPASHAPKKSSPKSKTPAVAGSHPKSAPVRPQTHSKTGSN